MREYYNNQQSKQFSAHCKIIQPLRNYKFANISPSQKFEDYNFAAARILRKMF